MTFLVGVFVFERSGSIESKFQVTCLSMVPFAILFCK